MQVTWYTEGAVTSGWCRCRSPGTQRVPWPVGDVYVGHLEHRGCRDQRVMKMQVTWYTEGAVTSGWCICGSPRTQRVPWPAGDVDAGHLVHRGCRDSGWCICGSPRTQRVPWPAGDVNAGHLVHRGCRDQWNTEEGGGDNTGGAVTWSWRLPGTQEVPLRVAAG